MVVSFSSFAVAWAGVNCDGLLFNVSDSVRVTTLANAQGESLLLRSGRSKCERTYIRPLSSTRMTMQIQDSFGVEFWTRESADE